MSYFVWFDFSSGLKNPITVPTGWTEKTLNYVADLEEALGIEREQYKDNPPHWKHTTYQGIPDEVLCELAENHNDWVRRVYDDFSKWSKTPPTDGETLTPERATEFWPALTMIHIPPQRWSRDYYRQQIEHLFDVMTDGEHQGVTFDEKKLTPKQAGEVIHLFAEYFGNDVELVIPAGYDFLMDAEECDWCEKCGKHITYDDNSCRRRKCPVRAEISEE